MGFSLQNFKSLVSVALQNKASDIHIRMDEAPCFRIRGDLYPVQTKAFSREDMQDVVKVLMGESNYKNLSEIYEQDGSFEIPEVCRLRYNFFRYNHSIGVILRIVSVSQARFNPCDRRHG